MVSWRLRRAVVPALVLASCFTSAPVWAAAAVGKISGKVVDAKGEPLTANVLLVGTKQGAMAHDDGTFTIAGVPVGTYSVTARLFGYNMDTKSGIAVDADKTAVVNFTLKETVVEGKEVSVTAQRKLIDVKASSTSHGLDAKTLKTLPVDSFREAIAIKPGIVVHAGQIHVRGGRSGEVQYQVDGVPVTDPLVGASADLATSAVSETEEIIGGLDARYGNAQSGIINTVTKEGDFKLSGSAQYMTDDYGAPDKTYDNFDRITFGLGGPFLVPKTTYFFTVEGTYDDGYLKTSEQRSRHTLLDFIRLGDRQNNDLKLQSKLAWKPDRNYKLTGEVIRNSNHHDSYYQQWSRDGYVQTFRDSLGNIRNYGRWSATQEDSTFEHYNAPSHTPNTRDDFTLYKLVWNHSLTKNSYYDLKLSQSQFTTRRDVLDHQPWEYAVRSPQYWLQNFDEGFFYATHGDFPLYYRRNDKVWNLKGDYTRKMRSHEFMTGFEASYNDLRLLSIDYPNRLNSQGEFGLLRSDYHYYNPEGSGFVQDRWEHEGMVLNVGMRYDAYSVGSQIPLEDLIDPFHPTNASGDTTYVSRVRYQVSPRLGIAYPVSDRDVMSFHYGRYSQFPDRRAVFEDRNSLVRARGNPTLQPETTISYQAAVQHLFTRDVLMQFGVYYKDIFGLLSTRQIAVPDTPDPTSIYVNRDYASSRGVELSFEKRFSHNFSGEINYTYGLATGLASDVDINLAQQGQQLYLPISEQALDYDQRHTVNARVDIQQPGKWGITFLWDYGSGFPYTPHYMNEKKFDPKTTNSQRLPSTSNLNFRADKYFTLYGQAFSIFLRGNNILDTRNIAQLEPDNPYNPYTVANEYTIYYTERGEAGGAYITDLNGDGINDFLPVHDPRVFEEGRVLRMGIGVTF